MPMIRSLRLAALVTVACLSASPGLAQTKWDLPAAYPATNFHSVNLNEFAADVDKASGGKLKITVHPGASLFKRSSARCRAGRRRSARC
jgi:TRAP-type transport system periplasmic protein